MTAKITTTAELIANHADMLADLFGEPASANPTELISQLETVASVYEATSMTTDAADALSKAANYLAEALEDPRREAQLIRRADKQLCVIDAMALA
ncbi:hypothetical protein [Kitasatospora kifunensis]|uniref:Uncharacterized protein n=1 Tax=Kitasatospora kifunensis TaxID=58351 RepID=A0A7W7QYP3_KITKI|nr:hypothetical protein [Kitasatospora kifunensis]MBB4922240.1 hypothetical protein [Kitasatospora kifunensis]